MDCGIHAREWIAPAFCQWFVKEVSVLIILLMVSQPIKYLSSLLGSLEWKSFSSYELGTQVFTSQCSSLGEMESPYSFPGTGANILLSSHSEITFIGG